MFLSHDVFIFCSPSVQHWLSCMETWGHYYMGTWGLYIVMYSQHSDTILQDHHALVYDKNTPKEALEWVDLKDVSCIPFHLMHVFSCFWLHPFWFWACLQLTSLWASPIILQTNIEFASSIFRNQYIDWKCVLLWFFSLVYLFTSFFVINACYYYLSCPFVQPFYLGQTSIWLASIVSAS